MAKAKKPSGAKGVMDVTHPDKSAPSGNSKSVIVSNRPLLKDPMVVPEGATPGEAAADEPPAATVSPKTDKTDTKTSTEPLPGIQPPDTSPETSEPDAAPALETKASVASSETAADDKTDQPNQPEPAANTADKNDTSATNQPDAEEDGGKEAKPETATEKNPAKDDKNVAPKPDAAAEEQAKHQAAVDKLADSKKYYLPIDTLEKKRSRRFVALGVLLSLLLVVAWADIALDAGLIHIGSLKSPTHFFSN